MKIWNVFIYNMVISKSIETSNNSSKYLPLVLILPKMDGYVKTFKGKINKFISFSIVEDKLLKKYKTIWTQSED